MKETILEIVQSCLSEMNSDNVNSIDDTVESQRVALLLKDIYIEMVDFRDWQQHKKLVTLDSSADNTKPNYLKLPENTQETKWVRYNRKQLGQTRDIWDSMTYLYPDVFIKQVNERNTDASNVDVITDWDGSQLSIVNDKAPQYWTSFDDTWLVFDSWDSSVESTLQSSNSQAYILTDPGISLVDGFVVDLPVDAFSAIKTALKERAFENIKQMRSLSVSAEAARQRNRMSRKNWKAMGGVRTPNYGRISARSGRYRNPTFAQDRD